jgi:hypothetical protein
MPGWRINPDNGSFAGLEADFVPKCPYCGTALEAAALKLFRFPLNEPDWWEKGIQNGHAIDVEVLCPNCGYWEPYGVACPKDYWEKIRRASQALWDAHVATQHRHFYRA